MPSHLLFKIFFRRRFAFSFFSVTTNLICIRRLSILNSQSWVHECIYNIIRVLKILLIIKVLHSHIIEGNLNVKILFAFVDHVYIKIFRVFL